MTLLSHQLKSANNVSFQKKNTKRSSSTLLRLVFFFSERTLCVKNVRTRVSITVYNWLKSGDIVTRRNRICSKSFSIVNCTIIIYLILKTIENVKNYNLERSCNCEIINTVFPHIRPGPPWIKALTLIIPAVEGLIKK